MMIKLIDIVSGIIVLGILILFLSKQFFPIEGMDMVYEKKFYFAILYIMLRFVKKYIHTKKLKNGQLS